MPLMDDYIAEVTVSVVLRSARDGQVAEYSVTRKAQGASAPAGETAPAQNMTSVVESAVLRAVAAEKAMRAGMQNAEARRLK